MAIVIGTDEAGYGPNLGPLVIAASAWHVPDATINGSSSCDLYDVLSQAICRESSGAAQLAIADSKALYKPGGSLERLEAGVFASLSTCRKYAERRACSMGRKRNS